MSTLFEIGDDLLSIERLIEERDGDITDPEVEAALDQWFSEVSGNQSEKLHRYYMLITKWRLTQSNAAAESRFLRDQAELADEKADQYRGRCDRLLERVKQHLEQMGQKRGVMPTGLAFVVCGNGGKEPVYIEPDTNPAIVPEDLVKVTREIDRDAVREALKVGRTLPWARLLPRGKHVRIS